MLCLRDRDAIWRALLNLRTSSVHTAVNRPWHSFSTRKFPTCFADMVFSLIVTATPVREVRQVVLSLIIR